MEAKRTMEHHFWDVVASIGDTIDNDYGWNDLEWKLYMNELHEWISSILVRGEEE